MRINSEEELIKQILNRKPELSREELEIEIKKKIDLMQVSRRTAIYLVAIEMGIRLDSPIRDYIKIGELSGNLSNIRIIGRILWLSGTQRLKQREGIYTRGGIGDDTGVAPIIFWDISREELEENGISIGTVIEIRNCYTRSNITGRYEIHVTRRSNINVADEDLPSIKNFLKPLHEISFSDEYVNTYGIVLTISPVKEVEVNDVKLKVRSLILGSEDKCIRVVLWREAVDEYSWIKVGDKIAVYNGRIRLNKFNEIEIHVSKISALGIFPGIEVNLKSKNIKISDIQPGYSINKLYVRVLVKGLKRFNPNTNMEFISIYVIDDTGDGCLTIMGKDLSYMDTLKVMDIISISKFRASIRGGSLYIFADADSEIEINPSDVPGALPIFSIPYRTSSTLTTTDKVVAIKGRIVRILDKEDIVIGDEVLRSLLLEDEEGGPMKIIYRGELSQYAKETLKEGDKVVIYGAGVDMSSLIMPEALPTLRLRAYSVIEKIK